MYTTHPGDRINWNSPEGKEDSDRIPKAVSEYKIDKDRNTVLWEEFREMFPELGSKYEAQQLKNSIKTSDATTIIEYHRPQGRMQSLKDNSKRFNDRNRPPHLIRRRLRVLHVTMSRMMLFLKHRHGRRTVAAILKIK